MSRWLMYPDDKANSKFAHIDLFNNQHYRKKNRCIVLTDIAKPHRELQFVSREMTCHRKGDMTPPDPNNTLQANWIKAPKK